MEEQLSLATSFRPLNFRGYVDRIYVTFADIAYHQQFCNNLQIMNAEKPRIARQDEEKGEKKGELKGIFQGKDQLPVIRKAYIRKM